MFDEAKPILIPFTQPSLLQQYYNLLILIRVFRLLKKFRHLIHEKNDMFGNYRDKFS